MAAPTPPQDNQIHIFLDLDGVLSDFDLHAHQENKLTPDGKVKWDALDYKWWVTMPAFEGAKEFYNDVKKLGIVKFLTAPVLSADCFSGKAQWIENFIPERGKFALLDLIICPSADKYLLARPNCILVDDSEKNVQAWEAAGSIGIYHNGDYTETLQKVQAAVAKLSGAAPKLVVNNKPGLK